MNKFLYNEIEYISEKYNEYYKDIIKRASKGDPEAQQILKNTPREKMEEPIKAYNPDSDLLPQKKSNQADSIFTDYENKPTKKLPPPAVPDYADDEPPKPKKSTNPVSKIDQAKRIVKKVNNKSRKIPNQQPVVEPVTKAETPVKEQPVTKAETPQTLTPKEKQHEIAGKYSQLKTSFPWKLGRAASNITGLVTKPISGMISGAAEGAKSVKSNKYNVSTKNYEPEDSGFISDFSRGLSGVQWKGDPSEFSNVKDEKQRELLAQGKAEQLSSKSGYRKGSALNKTFQTLSSAAASVPGAIGGALKGARNALLLKPNTVQKFKDTKENEFDNLSTFDKFKKGFTKDYRYEQISNEIEILSEYLNESISYNLKNL